MSVRFLICRESGFSNSRLKAQEGATAGEHGVCTRNNLKGRGEMRWGGSLEPGHTHRLAPPTHFFFWTIQEACPQSTGGNEHHSPLSQEGMRVIITQMWANSNSARDLYFLIFIPWYNLLPWGVGGTFALLPRNRLQWRWRSVCWKLKHWWKKVKTKYIMFNN